MVLIRSLLFNIFLYAWTALCSILALPLAALEPSRVVPFARFWSKTWLAAYRLICGVSYEVTGSEHLPAGACILAVKHQSTWDTFALFAIFGHPVVVLKHELMFIPVFGWVLKRTGFIFVKRGTGRLAMDGLIRGAAGAVAHAHQIVIFPEGTRSSLHTPAVYKSGVSYMYEALQIPCVPVALNSGLLWPRRTFLRRPGTITVEILPAIPAGLDRKEMFARMVESIEAASQRLCKP